MRADKLYIGHRLVEDASVERVVWRWALFTQNNGLAGEKTTKLQRHGVRLCIRARLVFTVTLYMIRPPDLTLIIVH